ncbi:hypothetical protein Emed_005558 [Eimeria media]
MATPQSDVEQAALKNYGAGNRFTPNTPFTPEGAAATAAAQRGPQGGPSPYALHQQRRGLTLADIRRRNLDEQQALRDEGHLKRYRLAAAAAAAAASCLGFLNYSSEDSALQQTTAKKLSTFYCSCCGSNVCVAEVALEDMPQRGTDSAYVLQRGIGPAVFAASLRRWIIEAGAFAAAAAAGKRGVPQAVCGAEQACHPAASVRA